LTVAPHVTRTPTKAGLSNRANPAIPRAVGMRNGREASIMRRPVSLSGGCMLRSAARHATPPLNEKEGREPRGTLPSRTSPSAGIATPIPIAASLPCVRRKGRAKSVMASRGLPPHALTMRPLDMHWRESTHASNAASVTSSRRWSMAGGSSRTFVSGNSSNAEIVTQRPMADSFHRDPPGGSASHATRQQASCPLRLGSAITRSRAFRLRADTPQSLVRSATPSMPCKGGSRDNFSGLVNGNARIVTMIRTAASSGRRGTKGVRHAIRRNRGNPFSFPMRKRISPSPGNTRGLSAVAATRKP
jgi:hypothetical protein